MDTPPRSLLANAQNLCRQSVFHPTVRVVCWRLRASDLKDVRQNLEASLADRIARDQMKWEPRWTESLAVGSARFVGKIKPLILSRRETEIEEGEGNLWVVKDQETPYGQKTGLKSAAF